MEEKLKGTSSGFVQNLQESLNKSGGNDFSTNGESSAVLQIRQNVLMGGFNLLRDSGSWRCAPWRLVVFISSTFTDTSVERNILMSELLPQLRQWGLQHEISVTFVDMRWGVRDENTLEHRTWDECLRELDRCRRESSGLFFLSLQSDKYGYIPLPRVIPADKFHSVLFHPKSPELLSLESRELAQQWYAVDSNAVPAVYILKPLLTLTDSNYWSQVLPTLVNVFADVCFCSFDGNENFIMNRDTEDNDIDYSVFDLLIGRSVTEWETKTALFFLENDRSDIKTRFVWFHREFSPESIYSALDPYKLYNDSLVDAPRALKIQSLKQLMTEKLKSSNNEYPYEPVPFDAYLANESPWVEHIDQWKTDVQTVLMQSLHEIEIKRKLWSLSSCGLGIAGNVAMDWLHHAEWAHAKCSNYFGRRALLDDAVKLLRVNEPIKANSAVNTISSTGRAIGLQLLSLAVVGQSGTGKTAFMARLADEIFKTQNISTRPVIIRFCGTNPSSSTGIGIARSICEQLEYLLAAQTVSDPANSSSTSSQLLNRSGYCRTPTRNIVGRSPSNARGNNTPLKEKQKTTTAASIPSFNKVLGNESLTYKQIVKRLHELLNLYPVILLIDSVDQLSNLDQARSELSFLTGVKPHPNTRIIVSSLLDEGKYYYGCDTKLQTAAVPRIEIKPLSVEFLTPAIRTQDGMASSPHVSTRENIRPLQDSCIPSITINRSSSEMVKKSEAFLLMHHLLQMEGRTLTELQWDYVMQQVAVEPIPLYIWLAVRVVHSWTSDMTIVTAGNDSDGVNCVSCRKPSCVLQPGVHNLIMQIFDEAEHIFGQLLTKTALGFITFAIQGVNDGEMEDLLSNNDEVMDTVKQYCKDTNRLPSHVWLRVRSALVGLVTERDGGCMVWYHRQLQEVVAARYTTREIDSIHVQLAQYFGNLVPSERVLTFGLSSQPLSLNESSIWMSTALPNNRRCKESVSHMLNARLFTEAVNELCNVDSICARAKNGLLFETITQLDSLLTSDVESGIQLSRSQITIVKSYYRWIKRNIYSLQADPQLMIPFTLSDLPPDAICRIDMNTCLALHPLGVSLSRLCWVRCQELGHKDDVSGLDAMLHDHTGDVTCVAFSLHGQYIATGSADKTIKMWNAGTGNCMSTLSGHRGQVTAVLILEVNVDGQESRPFVVSSSADSMIHVWDPITGIIIASFSDCPHRINCIDGVCIAIESDVQQVDVHSTNGLEFARLKSSVDSDVHIDAPMNIGQAVTPLYTDQSVTQIVLIAGTDDKNLYTWDVTVSNSHSESAVFRPTITANCSQLKGHTNKINAVCCSHDAATHYFASASSDATIRIWDRLTGATLITAKENGNITITSVDFNHDGSRFVTGAWDKSIKIWNGSEVQQSIRGSTAGVNCVKFAGEDKIVSSALDNAISVWDCTSGTLVRSLKGHTASVGAIAISQDGLKIASASNDSAVGLWSMPDLRYPTAHVEAIRTTSGRASNSTEPVPESTIPNQSSTEGPLIVEVSGSTVLTRQFLTPECGEYVADRVPELEMEETGQINDIPAMKSLERGICGHTRAVRSVNFSKDGSKLVSASIDKSVCVWDTVTGEQILNIKNNCAVNSACFSPDGTKIIAGTADFLVKLFDSTTGNLNRILTGQKQSINCVVISTDGSRILSSGDDSCICSWNTTVFPKTMEGTTPTAIEPWKIFEGHSGRVQAIDLSSDGNILVSASWDKSIKVWDLSNFANKTGKIFFSKSLVVQPTSSTAQPIAISLLPNGLSIIAGYRDGKVRIWDNSTSRPSVVYHFDHLGGVTSVGYYCKLPTNPSTRLQDYCIVSGSEDSSIRVWDGDGGEQLNMFAVDSDVVTCIACIQSYSGNESDATVQPYTRLASGMQAGNARLWGASPR